MDFDAIIIGSGFGGNVASSFLTKGNKRRVLMLERGTWWNSPERSLPKRLEDQPVQYWPRPNHASGLIDLLSLVHTNHAPGLLEHLHDAWRGLWGFKKPQALYRYNVFDDVHVVTASGVGGGSLIYSNVTLEPYHDGEKYPVMDGWSPGTQLTKADYQVARQWATTKRGPLARVVTRIPLQRAGFDGNLPAQDEFLYLAKSRVLRNASAKLKARWASLTDKDLQGFTMDDWQALELALFEYEGAPVNKGGFCERQGRCLMGCLPGARQTLGKSLVAAMDAGAPLTVRAGVEVTCIKRADGKSSPRRWQIAFRDLRTDQEAVATADVVVLAAGVLGSTEVLLRSAGGLALSDALGSKFSTNGDFLGFVIAQPQPATAIDPWYASRGPINTSHVAIHNGKLHATIEDGAVPAMLAEPVRAALHVLENAKHTQSKFLEAMSALWVRRTRQELAEFLPFADPWDPKRSRTEDEMMMDVFFFNCMGTDGAPGRMSLRKDRLAIEAPTLKDHPVFRTLDAMMRELAGDMGGKFIPSPLWDGFGDRKLVTVHPLGGCPMGASSSDGVVNRRGQVFNTRTGADTVHEGLYVIDGSIIPDALAVNPTFTIMALANRICSEAFG
ncbi:MAG TPA: GMC oxidoreductase [Kofleriaceae bacterium]